ncbi:DNA-directed RNA polymerase III subunit RPC4 isoform X1 [Macrobrachium rosenbergii]
MAEQNGEMKAPAPGRASGASTGVGNPSPGPSTSISARLPSFRAPRDLTLSASSSATPVKVSLMSRPRKNFLPNIPVRREKAGKVPESRSDKAPKTGHERDKKEGGRGRGRGKEFVQTTGSLFGDGIAANITRRGGYSFGGGGGGGGRGTGRGSEAGFINKPVLNLDTVNHIDKEHEDQRLKEILRDDFIDDLEDVIGRDGREFLPVQLPMVDTGRGFKEEGQEESEEMKFVPPSTSADSDLKIKEEPADYATTQNGPGVKDIAQDTKNIKLMDTKMPMKGGLSTKERPPELSVAQLLTGKHEDVMFFQLPNSLPSLPPEIKQEPNSKPSSSSSSKVQKPATSSNAASDDEDEVDKKAKTDYCTLNTLQEGMIATCKIYKSGKTELWFGEHRLTVNKGTQVGFLQDVVSVEIDEESKTGTMTVLGHIGHRLVCSPDLETLVKQKKS